MQQTLTYNELKYISIVLDKYAEQKIADIDLLSEEEKGLGRAAMMCAEYAQAIAKKCQAAIESNSKQIRVKG